VQHQAHTQVRGRHRRTDALHSHRAPAPQPATVDEAAYRALLTSTEPLTAAMAAAPATASADAYRALLTSTEPLTAATAAPHTTASADAYRALLTSDAPLADPPVEAGGNRAARRAADRTSRRTPRKPIAPALLGERGRNAVITAALVAGVSVAGVSAAAAGAARADAAAQARTRTATHISLNTPAPAAATTTGGAAHPRSVDFAAPESTPALAYVRAQRKAKPVPTVKWVNPMPDGTVTSCFGERWGRLHAGVDLATTAGTPIRAAGAGIVVTAGPAEGYGNAVLIDHGNGYLTHYGHMSVVTVRAGQHIKVGEQIGNEGSTGHSTGPHLHFEVHEGMYKNPIEPTRWLHDHGVDIPGCATDIDHTDG
jgi:murein DD-endopeptidase MepM/ murein hydrolase activator NlpD